MAKQKTLFNLQTDIRETDSGRIAEIDIDGVIGFDFMLPEDEQNLKENMRNQLREINAIEADNIIVNISSLGGDIDHGLAIHDLLASNEAEVETNITGMTASAATVIAQAGDIRRISDNAMFLVHRAWTLAVGNTNDMRAMADDLEKIDGRIANIYAKRGERSVDEFITLMNEANGDGIWLDSNETLAFGLVDEITEPMKIAASAKDFRHAGLPVPKRFKDVEARVEEHLIQAIDRAISLKDSETFEDLQIAENSKTGSLYELTKETTTTVDASRLQLEILKLKGKYHE
jgi:ATP-dependent protease ClpP protease subunit